MPGQDFEDAIGFVEETNTSALAMSQALHHLRGGVYHPLIPLAPDSLGYRSADKPAAPEAAPPAPGVTVSPNPFTTVVTFDFGNLADPTEHAVEITGLSGRRVWQREGIAGGSRVAWDAAALPDGIYFYRIRSGLGGHLAHGKLLKITN